ncbi:MAG: efflux RND transporter periplasmic adaptor subunit [Gammaproteobacteria bacterium]|nr:efflux RND transporter periplasmic adaptor subunit [Gammaproteobacteria bacterium]
MSLVLSGCHPHEPDARQLPPLVRIAQVAANTQPERGFTGVVSARVQSDLGFRVSGKVMERLVDNGQSVRRGQCLMRIDTADLKLATTARQSAVEAARARATQTASDEQRYRALAARGLVSAILYEQSKTAAESAAAELRVAEAQANVARNEASYSVLLSDADGVVAQTLAEPGQVVAAGQTVIRLAHAGPREASVNLPETFRPTVGSMAKARLYAEENSLVSAKLRQLSESADASTRTYEARYVLDGAAAEAPLGSTVTVLIPGTRQITALQIPLSALTDRGRGTGVWVIKLQANREATVAWRSVSVSVLGDEIATVVGGLNAGDRFVAMGAHLLRPGDRVRLADRDRESESPGLGP